ncbi:MAG: molybdenum cofactor guanylyltransferase [Cocleimonas sp.]|nr:molybdenum cofactor guanylyltransferase [Cocleimonas sp.]
MIINITKNDITALILAGGRGQRLGGKDKGLVCYKNKPFIEHVLERIEPQVSTVLINANRNKAQYQAYGYPVIQDSLAHYQGPLAGLLSAMPQVKTRYILMLPCDAPLLPLDLGLRMISSIAYYPEHILLAHDGQQTQFVHALIPTRLQANLEQFLAQGERRVGLWYAQHQVKSVDFSDIPEAFSNINTPEQHKSMEKNHP